MRALYFAWLRERLGKADEDLVPPPGIDTPRAMIGWLCGLDPAYEAAFANMNLVRCAVNQEFCSLDTKLDGATEIAFFPPVTGG